MRLCNPTNTQSRGKQIQFQKETNFGFFETIYLMESKRLKGDRRKERDYKTERKRED